MTKEMQLTVQALRGGNPNRVWLDRAADTIERLSAERDAALDGIWLAGRFGVTDAEVLIAFDECGLNTARAGEQLYMTPKAVRYRIRKVRYNTGKNPYDRTDLDELLPIARAILEKRRA